MSVIPNIHLQGNCIEAIEVYKRAFNLEVNELLLNGEADPSDFISAEEAIDLVYHAELLLNGTRILMSDLDPNMSYKSGNTVSLTVSFNSNDDVMKAYEALKDGAEIITPPHSTTYSSCFVSLIDRFGLRWELMREIQL